MNQRIGVFALLALVCVAAAQTPQDQRERIARVERNLLPAVVVKGNAIAPMKLDDRMRHYHVPGVSIAVIEGGQIAWARGYGALEAGGTRRVTPETLFQAASISKPVTALAALRLVEQGKLSLDEDVNARLRTWKIPESPLTAEKKVTIRGLLSHTAGLTVSGFPGYKRTAPLPTLRQILDGERPANTPAIRVDFTPGTQQRYSGGGYTVLQQLLIDVSGKPFELVLQQMVLGPLEMRSSTFAQPLPQKRSAEAATAHTGSGKPVPGKWHTYPELAAAGLWTTPSDLARFAIEIQKARAGQSRFLSAEMAAAMLTRHSDDAGLGLVLAGSGKTARFSHDGSNEGYRCLFVAYQETGQGAAIMTNGANGNALTHEILRAISREYNWTDYKPREVTVATVNPAEFAAYAGEYIVMPGFRLDVSVKNEKLLLQILGRSYELLPESSTSYFSFDFDGKVIFLPGADGRVRQLLLETYGRTWRAKRTPSY